MIQFGHNQIAFSLLYQLFERRAKHVKANEKSKWDQLTPDFMSEESDGEDEEGSTHLVLHKPEWRSDGTYTLYITYIRVHLLIYLNADILLTVLCSYLDVLDKRFLEAHRGKARSSPRLARILGQPLTGPPPPAALSALWTVKESARPPRVSTCL